MNNDNKLDLKQRLSEIDIKSLNGLTSFSVAELSDKTLDELAFFADRLEKVGISLEIIRKTGFDFVILNMNKEKYQATTTRHAGRKADFESKYDNYGKCTVRQLKEKLNSTSKTKIAEELGCSRMTLYRIIKNIEQRNPDGDTSIWHYTS